MTNLNNWKITRNKSTGRYRTSRQCADKSSPQVWRDYSDHKFLCGARQEVKRKMAREVAELPSQWLDVEFFYHPADIINATGN